MRRLALKILTRSDLSFFEAQFRKDSTSKQKAINLNADVFVGAHYPGLLGLLSGRSSRIPVNLVIYGPGPASEFAIARKIVRSPGSKNWRLNGELVPDPEVERGRFARLEPEDLAVIEFEGDPVPDTVRLILISRTLPEDAPIYSHLTRILADSASMVAVDHQELERVLAEIGDADRHPLVAILSDAAIEDVALGGAQGAETILRRSSMRRMSLEELQQARRNAEAIGQLGEEYVNAHLERQKNDGRIHDFSWASADNVIAPYDFVVIETAREYRIHVDVKATAGDFKRPIHVSLNELREMATTDSRYDLYRLFNVASGGADLRVCGDLRATAVTILSALKRLPAGVLVDGISIVTESLPFGNTEHILAPIGDDA